MKKFFTILLVLIVSVATLSTTGAQQSPRVRKPVHFQAVDDSGHPLPGVKFILFWWCADGSGSFEKLFVSDQDGRFCPDGSFPGDDAFFKSMEKEGYAYEDYLNRGPGRKSWMSSPYPREHPYKLVFRKKLPEQGLILCHEDKNNKMKVFQRGEKNEPLPLSVVPRPGYKESQPADCFAMPEFDEVKKAWKCIFWTTNVNGGVLATTNRVFIAPVTGYQKRIEVPMEMCSSPTFTLYVKTYDPLLYAMFWIHCFGRDREDGSQTIEFERGRIRNNQEMSKPFVGIAIDNCHFNISGERFLESDSHADEALGWQFYTREVLPALAQHRYPPRPDIPARAKNMQRRKELRVEIDETSKKILYIWAKAKGDRQKYEKELTPLHLHERECEDEIKRLEAEARKLNLPD